MMVFDSLKTNYAADVTGACLIHFVNSIHR